MKKILIICFFCCLVNNAFALTETRNYTKNGITCVATLTTTNGGLSDHSASCKDQDNNTVFVTWGNFNNITYDSNGNIINQRFYHNSRWTYELNENGQIISRKSSWDGPIEAIYKYTPEGKILVFGTDGQLNGVYNDVFEYHLWDTSFKYTSSDYIENMNKISEDGNFYEYDTNGKIKEVYYSNGEHKKFSANGDYTLYDKNGNNLGVFKSDGTKRRIYNVDEATAVVKKGAKNNFSIKYR